MAFGQVMGTNFVNLSLFLLADLAYRGGPVVGELGAFEIVSALLGLILIGIFQIGLLERRDPVFLRAGYAHGEGLDTGAALGVEVRRDRYTVGVAKSFTSVLEPEREPYQFTFGIMF